MRAQTTRVEEVIGQMGRDGAGKSWLLSREAVSIGCDWAWEGSANEVPVVGSENLFSPGTN